jgi:hypothetical protein
MHEAGVKQIRQNIDYINPREETIDACDFIPRKYLVSTGSCDSWEICIVAFVMKFKQEEKKM